MPNLIKLSIYRPTPCIKAKAGGHMTTIKAIETKTYSVSLVEAEGGYIVGYSVIRNGEVYTKLTNILPDYNTASMIFEEKVEEFYTQH